MMKKIKCAGAWLLTLVMVLSAFGVAARADNSGSTMVESVLNFLAMDPIAEGSTNAEREQSRQAARERLLQAGALEVENLFLKGNWETIVNPGGYNGVGYYVQKVEAVPGETIGNAVLNLGYWVATGDPQGYVQVYTSTDNRDYTLVWEQREGNGDPFNGASRRSESIELPVEQGQTVLYVKVAMEHWNTYEGAGVAYSSLTINASSGIVETDKTPEECTRVTNSYNFNGLTQGEVSAEDIGAVEESNMFYGIDDVLLLTPRNGYEVASATWMIEAAPGEPLNDLVLNIIGRTWFVTESVKDDNYLRVYASVDGVQYQQMHEFRSNDNPDDTQRFTVDLTEAVQGHARAYVKLEWLVFDSPHIFGIRSVSLTANTAGVDEGGEQGSKMAFSNIQSFTSLPVGEADAAALDAFKSANLMFGYNNTPLLTASEAGEDAYATWKLSAPEGVSFEDLYLVLIGRFGYVNADKKDTSSMQVFLSLDGEKYNEVRRISPTDDPSDRQQITIDLSAQTYGLQECYVRIYWRSEDDPSAMGLRVMALVANAGEDYAQYLPELVDRDLSGEENPPEPTQPAPSGEPQTPAPFHAGWIVAAAAAAVVIVAAVIVLLRRKKAK